MQHANHRTGNARRLYFQKHNPKQRKLIHLRLARRRKLLVRRELLLDFGVDRRIGVQCLRRDRRKRSDFITRIKPTSFNSVCTLWMLAELPTVQRGRHRVSRRCTGVRPGDESDNPGTPRRKTRNRIRVHFLAGFDTNRTGETGHDRSGARALFSAIRGSDELLRCFDDRFVCRVGEGATAGGDHGSSDYFYPDRVRVGDSGAEFGAHRIDVSELHGEHHRFHIQLFQPQHNRFLDTLPRALGLGRLRQNGNRTGRILRLPLLFPIRPFRSQLNRSIRQLIPNMRSACFVRAELDGLPRFSGTGGMLVAPRLFDVGSLGNPTRAFRPPISVPKHYSRSQWCFCGDPKYFSDHILPHLICRSMQLHLKREPLDRRTLVRREMGTIRYLRSHARIWLE